jgi:hypothetical protein
MKTFLDKWYEDNLENKYGKYISDGIFCNDRQTSLLWGDLAYNAYKREYNPTLLCSSKQDRYTKNDMNGNGLLQKPVGLLTTDEVTYGGSLNKNYLNIGNYTYFRTMSPTGFVGDSTSYVATSGEDSIHNIFRSMVHDKHGAPRPVINLKADVKFKGSGTIDDPYVIVME